MTTKILRDLRKAEKLIRDEYMYDFPCFLRALRAVMGISRTVLAFETGIPYQKLTNWEDGRYTVKADPSDLYYIEKFFGIEDGLMKKKFIAYAMKQLEKKNDIELNAIEATARCEYEVYNSRDSQA